MFKFVIGMVLPTLFMSVNISKAENAWPIKFIDGPMAITSHDEYLDEPSTSQPLNFDPSKHKSFSEIENFQSKSQIKLANGMTINAYYFDTDDDASYVLEVINDGKRHALYTQVLNYRVVDSKFLLIDNMLQVKAPQKKGSVWQRLNRLIDVTTKKATGFPGLDCTRFFAPEPNHGIVTYGSGTKNGDSFGPPRNVCIWNNDGKLVKALSAPIQNTMANSEETSNQIGLLPADPNTFYQLSYDHDHCVMRLQSLNDLAQHRVITLPVGKVSADLDSNASSGDYGDACEQGTSIQVEFPTLTLAGGEIRFRSSMSGRGDLKPDWNAWTTYK